jgi:hypothetical protein
VLLQLAVLTQYFQPLPQLEVDVVVDISALNTHLLLVVQAVVVVGTQVHKD